MKSESDWGKTTILPFHNDSTAKNMSNWHSVRNFEDHESAANVNTYVYERSLEINSNVVKVNLDRYRSWSLKSIRLCISTRLNISFGPFRPWERFQLRDTGYWIFNYTRKQLDCSDRGLEKDPSVMKIYNWTSWLWSWHRFQRRETTQVDLSFKIVKNNSRALIAIESDSRVLKNNFDNNFDW